MSPSFSSPPVVVGLDIGTTKICALVAGEGEPGKAGASAEGTLQILGVGIVPSLGVRRGVVVDVPDTITAIKDAVARAAHMAGVEIEGVVAGVTGDHIISQNRTGSVTVASRGNQVSAFDVDRALSAALIEVARDREIIHSLPRSWSVDEERGIKKPIGIVGTRLEVETHVVTGQGAILRNTLSCLSGAGVRADALVLEPLASAEAVTTRAEREMGALVIDIGGGTTDLAAYFDGSVVYSAALPVGGNHVTRDVSIGLSTPFEFAEKLKVGSGAATRDMIPHGEALEVLTAGGASRLRIPRALLGEIIEARMRELFELSLSMAMNGGLQGLVPAGIVLSGGGALLPGSVELAEKIFGMPVRLGVPESLSGWSEPVSSPQFSTAVGLCRFALAQKREARSRASNAIALPNARRVWGQIAPGTSMARPLGAPPKSAPQPDPPVAAPAPPIPVPAPPQQQTAPQFPVQEGPLTPIQALAREEFPAQMRFAPSPEPDSTPESAPKTEPESAPAKSATAPAKRESAPAKPATAPAKPVTTPAKSAAEVEPAVKSDLAATVASPLETRLESAPEKRETAPSKAPPRGVAPAEEPVSDDDAPIQTLEPMPPDDELAAQQLAAKPPTAWSRFWHFFGFGEE